MNFILLIHSTTAFATCKVCLMPCKSLSVISQAHSVSHHLLPCTIKMRTSLLNVIFALIGPFTMLQMSRLCIFGAKLIPLTNLPDTNSAVLEIKWAILYLSSRNNRILAYLTAASKHGVIFNGHKRLWHFLFVINDSMLYDPYV